MKAAPPAGHMKKPRFVSLGQKTKPHDAVFDHNRIQTAKNNNIDPGKGSKIRKNVIFCKAMF